MARKVDMAKRVDLIIYGGTPDKLDIEVVRAEPVTIAGVQLLIHRVPKVSYRWYQVSHWSGFRLTNKGGPDRKTAIAEVESIAAKVGLAFPQEIEKRAAAKKKELGIP